MSKATARQRVAAVFRRSRQSLAEPGLPWTKITASVPSWGPASKRGVRVVPRSRSRSRMEAILRLPAAKQRPLGGGRSGKREVAAELVEGGPLGGRPARRVGGGDQLLGVQLGAVLGAGHPADRLLHQRPTKVVYPPAQRLGGG